jgi:hypothetical protein
MAVSPVLQMIWICQYQIPDDQSDVTITSCRETFQYLITLHWVTDINITWHTETFPNIQRPSEHLTNLPDLAHHLQLPTYISDTEEKQVLVGDMFYVVIFNISITRSPVQLNSWNHKPSKDSQLRRNYMWFTCNSFRNTDTETGTDKTWFHWGLQFLILGLICFFLY